MTIRKDIFLNTSTQFDKRFDGFPQDKSISVRQRLVRNYMMNSAMGWQDALKGFFSHVFNLGRYALYNILSAPFRFINKISVNYAFLNKASRKKFISIAGVTNVVGIAVVSFTKGLGFSFGFGAPVLAVVTLTGLYLLETRPDKIKEISNKINQFAEDAKDNVSAKYRTKFNKNDEEGTLDIESIEYMDAKITDTLDRILNKSKEAVEIKDVEMGLASVTQELDLTEELANISLGKEPEEIHEEELIMDLPNLNDLDLDLSLDLEEEEPVPSKVIPMVKPTPPNPERSEGQPVRAAKPPEQQKASTPSNKLKSMSMPKELDGQVMLNTALNTKGNLAVAKDKTIPEELLDIEIEGLD